MRTIILLGVVSSVFFFSSCKKDDENPTFTLTVNSGTGSGTYQEDEVINVQANEAPDGQVFEAWTGDTDIVADVNAASTSVTIPDRDVTITATYTSETFTLTVENGTGSGDYEEGATVNIEANAAETGKKFKAWTGDVDAVDDVTAAATTLTMPGQATTVTATYVDIYTLTVENGAGSGEYEEGEEVEIAANKPADGQGFLNWTGSSEIADTNEDTTSITMPANDVTVTANFAPTAEAFLPVTWKEAQFYEKSGDSFEAINTNGNYRVTFEFTENEKGTYTTVFGNLSSIPNYGSKSASGTFSVDDLGNPTVILFDEGDSQSTAQIESITKKEMVLMWVVENNIDGKPNAEFKLELIPE
ncbi:MAG: InlB B-repeat-containing protein [Candidatus Cyclobacteriaceae bacterium M3_2C_046]